MQINYGAQKCLFYSTNANNAERNLTSSCAYTRIRSFAPIAAARPSVIIRARCILRRGKRARNARGIVKLAAVVNNRKIQSKNTTMLIKLRAIIRTREKAIFSALFGSSSLKYESIPAFSSPKIIKKYTPFRAKQFRVSRF